MNDFKFVSENYSKQYTQKYRLSIQVNPDGFSILMTGEENKILQIVHRQTGSVERTRKLFRSEESLVNLRECNFQSVEFLINSSSCSLIPSQNEIQTDTSLVLSTDFSLFSEDQIIFRDIEKIDTRLVFTITGTMQEFLGDFRNHPKIQHITSKILNFEVQKSSPESALLYTTPGLLHISLKHESVLKYHNIFECRTDDEIIYHVMNTFQTLGYESKKEIVYMGHLVKKQPAWKVLNSYLPGLRSLPHDLPFDLAWDAGENYFNFLLPHAVENHQW